MTGIISSGPVALLRMFWPRGPIGDFSFYVYILASSPFHWVIHAEVSNLLILRIVRSRCTFSLPLAA